MALASRGVQNPITTHPSKGAGRKEHEEGLRGIIMENAAPHPPT